MNKTDHTAGNNTIWGSFLRKNTGDIILAILFILVIAMIVVPLIPAVLDILICFNISLSFFIFSLALFIKRPVSFVSFPSLLLIATLYRLALNVASTRLILLKADAGRIIGGFGTLVVGGDIIVGAVIFGILSLVLFLVITKGAERVAEVSARFTLDSLPGMQLAIDADLRSKAISSMEAQRRRSKLDNHSRYYGSLDGAMKFVRGDALAALLITLVNIAGGLTMGIVRHDMSVTRALDVYGRLTIGDGLVTLIPALLISTAAGLLVTRIGQGESRNSLGQQLGMQIARQPKALLAASGILWAMVFVPGLPAWPFVVFASIFGVSGIISAKRTRHEFKVEDDIVDYELEPQKAVAVINLGSNLYEMMENASRDIGGIRVLERKTASSVSGAIGLPLPKIPILKKEKAVLEQKAQLMIRGIADEKLDMPGDLYLVATSEKKLGGTGVKPLGEAGRNLYFCDLENFKIAQAAGFKVFEPVDAFIHLITRNIKTRADRLVGIEEVQRMTDKAALSRPALVRETVPRIADIPTFTNMLKQLVLDGISLEYLVEIMEAMAFSKPGLDATHLTAKVRKKLAPYITDILSDDDNVVHVLVLENELESLLNDNLVSSDDGLKLVMPPEMIESLVREINKSVVDTEFVIILVTEKLRYPLCLALKPLIKDIKVVAHGELNPDASVKIIDTIKISQMN